jgi:GTP cyclohydrolase IA
MTLSAQTALVNGAGLAQAPPRTALHVSNPRKEPTWPPRNRPQPHSWSRSEWTSTPRAWRLPRLGWRARTPTRAYAEMLSPRPFDLTTFPNDAGYDELIIARSIPVQSVCEHHLLPFVGVAHVGYLPGERILGLSKLARVVELFARRPQVQERLTQQIADWLQDQLAPRGVGVVVAAEHLCMTVRGVRASGANTLTSALHGQLRSDAASRAEFSTLIAAHDKAHQ